MSSFPFNYSTSVVKHLDAEMITLAGADSARTSSLATTDGAYLKAVAQADKDFQVATAQAALNGLTGAANQFTLNGTSTVVNTPQAVYAAESADATKTAGPTPTWPGSRARRGPTASFCETTPVAGRPTSRRRPRPPALFQKPTTPRRPP